MQIRSQRQTLPMVASATWQSFVVLTYPTGLPADHICATGERASYTSPTNIGAYIWSTLVAHDLRIITHGEAEWRIQQTLQTLARMERHAASGQFYNWYDAATTAAQFHMFWVAASCRKIKSPMRAFKVHKIIEHIVQNTIKGW